MRTHFLLLVGLIFVLPTARGENRLDESNSWAFAAPSDSFTDAAELDLRYLNEQQSGQSGFVRLSEDGNSFVRGDGQPIRFWIVGTDAYRFEPEDMDRHVRWLAKLGVNMTRLHVTVCQKKEGSKITDLNEELIDGIYRFIKAAKATELTPLQANNSSVLATHRSALPTRWQR